MSKTNTKRDEIFTPFSRIPPIGTKNTNFKNFKAESKALEIGMRHPTMPLRKRKLPPQETSKSIEETGRLLIRRKTYIVLEPLICKTDAKS